MVVTGGPDEHFAMSRFRDSRHSGHWRADEYFTTGRFQDSRHSCHWGDDEYLVIIRFRDSRHYSRTQGKHLHGTGPLLQVT